MPPETLSPIPPDLAHAEEAAAWRPIEGSWRPLYGSFPGEGMSVEWHDFETEKPFDWSRSFHAPSLEICLNFSGEARFGMNGAGKEMQPLAARQAALYTTGKERLKAQRLPGMRHRFVTIELSAGFMGTALGTPELRAGLRDDVHRFLDAPEESVPLLEIFPLPTALLALREQLLEPPVPPAARPLWYPAKVAEVMGQILFKAEGEPELFCERRKRQMRERIDRVCFLLKRDLENPPTLEMLAKEVGCSTFYLSRTFSQAVGMTLPQYLRGVRIERAAELLRNGGKGGAGKTVTEVAFEVGYTSLSAFNSAFVEIIGCCPGLYPMAANSKIAMARRPSAANGK
ncbi:AraC-type DNA-binding protein [Verrucomicrobium sp. GAS474]|uniref:helix-turn-helix transcriptional regulator n=1 Tax=Verrucomicrobium sp. GAS474 TaxID=1882831 RepID=UPI00087924B3|nr:AraC family transcriptional regulator [Verrucomicrobium sp. GAS474]SDU00375.1 AraC-type DNA-binding protein [Verrucomicrobium sp. GAS474]